MLTDQPLRTKRARLIKRMILKTCVIRENEIVKKKKTFITLLVLLCGLAIFSFYKSQQNDLKSKVSQLSGEIIDQANINTSLTSKKEGQLAYEYLTYFQKQLPGRLAFSEAEEKTAITLLSFLKDIGYNEKDIKIQTINTDKNQSVAAPMQDIEEGLGFGGGESIGRSHNIVITKNGESKQTIIVGAHYDSVGNYGVDDNGSGVSLILETLNRIKDKDVPFTIKFILFGAEEIGMVGSNHYVDLMGDDEIKNTLFMINIDTILAGDYAYLYGGEIQSDGKVIKTDPVEKSYKIAEEFKLEIILPPRDNPDVPFPTGQKRSDHAPFSNKGIPYVYFEANNWESGTQIETEKAGLIMHTEKDDLDYIEETFPKRSIKHLEDYSILLNEILTNWK